MNLCVLGQSSGSDLFVRLGFKPNLIQKGSLGKSVLCEGATFFWKACTDMFMVFYGHQEGFQLPFDSFWNF